MDAIFPSDDACTELLYWYGWAVFESSGLEESLVLLIAVSACSFPEDRGTPTIRAIMDHRRRQTLGALVREAKNSLGLPQELVDEFDDALVRRNWLIHSFYRYRMPEMVNDQRRAALFRRLRELKDLFAGLHKRADEELHRRLRARGFSPDAIQEKTNEYLLMVKQGRLDPDE